MILSLKMSQQDRKWRQASLRLLPYVCRKYIYERKTTRMQVPYYVKSDFRAGDGLARLERQIEEDYVNMLRQNCYRERAYRESIFWLNLFGWTGETMYMNTNWWSQSIYHLECRTLSMLIKHECQIDTSQFEDTGILHAIIAVCIMGREMHPNVLWSVRLSSNNAPGHWLKRSRVQFPLPIHIYVFVSWAFIYGVIGSSRLVLGFPPGFNSRSNLWIKFYNSEQVTKIHMSSK